MARLADYFVIVGLSEREKESKFFLVSLLFWLMNDVL